MSNYLENFNGSLPDLLTIVFDRFRDKPAYHTLGTTLTFDDVDRYSAAFAAYLQQETDLKPGDRVAVQLPNLIQYPVVAYGISRAGMVLVNVNPQYTARELEHQLNDSGAKGLIVLENFAHVASQVLDKTLVRQVWISRTGDLLPGLKRHIVNTVVKHVRKQIPDYHIPSAQPLRKALLAGLKYHYTHVDTPADSLAVIQYTGGTTGVSKGAMLTHANLIANTRQLRESLDGVVEEKAETFIAPLPLYHIYAFQFHLIVLPSTGTFSVLIPDPRDIPSFVKTLKSFRFSGFLGINTLFSALCANEDFHQLDFSPLKFTTSGGMALTQDVAKRWMSVTGCDVCEGYGMTEASPVICVNNPLDNHAETVGRPLPGTDIKLIDEEGHAVAAGEPGELCVQGPQVMSGYWQRAEETAKTFTKDGWLRTGDIAIILENGCVKIVDRLKDMIIVSGFNVYPNEIDDVLTSHPDIHESAVVGVEDVKSGESIKAFVVTNNKDLTADTIRAYCREQLTGYKVPKEVVFTDQLPKSNVGKVLRRELQASH